MVSNINFVYYGSYGTVVPTWQTVCGYGTLEAYMASIKSYVTWDLQGDETRLNAKSLAGEEAAIKKRMEAELEKVKKNNFKIKFIDELILKYWKEIGNDYFFFILARVQLKQFMEDIKSVGMDKFLVYESNPVTNTNYPHDPGKLKYFIFKFPENFAKENNV